MIPVRIDASTPPLGFGQVQSVTLDAARERDAAFAELARAVRRLINDDGAQTTHTTRAIPRTRTLRWLAVGIVVLIAGATAMFLVPHVNTASTPERSIAVLPFTDLSEAHDHAYLGDGIAEEIINQLSRVPGLHVSARTSSFSFKGRQITVRQIAQELGAAQVLEGSLRVDANRLRVTTQLVSADCNQLWSERYDRELRDVFAVQDVSRRRSRSRCGHMSRSVHSRVDKAGRATSRLISCTCKPCAKRTRTPQEHLKPPRSI